MSEVRDQLIRQVRQRLEGLRRAGLDRLAIPDLAALPRMSASPRPARRSSVAAPVASIEPDPPATTQIAKPVEVAELPPRPIAPPRPIEPARAPKLVAALFDEPGFDSDPIPPADRPALLAALAAEVAACERCPLLASTRTQTVFGEGSPTARLMFIGEAPGAVEDRTGRPFVGPSGVLLNDMITKGMGLAREDVYIANILKSRPPENRNPLPDEVSHCRPFLDRQIEIVRPEFLCLLGKPAAASILDTAIPLGGLRKRWHRFRGIPTIVTYHPAYLLRNPAGKKDAWEDLKMLMRAMGLKPPGPRVG